MIKLTRRFTLLVPDFIKNSRLFNEVVVKRLHKGFWDLDWKIKFKDVSDEGWTKYYDLVNSKAFRDEDMTEKQKDEVINNLVGKTVLEVGCGTGKLCIKIAKRDYDVSCLDASKFMIDRCMENASKENVHIKSRHGFLESLPYRDKFFDTVVCCDTLEHVRDLKKSVHHLKRVARKRVIVLVPRQKYSRYTPDLHTQFFETEGKLERIMNIPSHFVKMVDGDMLYVGDLERLTH
jgi:2-polyprenyl-3-methyl-5-hydroxy-6-metoxy-1,4-benzoquinol methylase